MSCTGRHTWLTSHCYCASAHKETGTVFWSKCTERKRRLSEAGQNVQNSWPNSKRWWGIFSVSSFILFCKLIGMFLCCDFYNKASFNTLLLPRSARADTRVLGNILVLLIPTGNIVMGFGISDPSPRSNSLWKGAVLDLWAKKTSTDLTCKESHAKSKKRFFWTVLSGACLVAFPPTAY